MREIDEVLNDGQLQGVAEIDCVWRRHPPGDELERLTAGQRAPPLRDERNSAETA